MIRINEKAITNLLSDLVSIESVNPMGKRVKGKIYKEEKIAQYVTSYLEDLGLKVILKEVSPGRPNIVGTLEVDSSKGYLALEAHLDTVQVEGMEIKPFQPKVVNGSLYGRGACDAKGSLAAMLFALKAVIEEKINIQTNIYFLATVDEENGCQGARALVKEGLRVKAAIVGEPTNLDLIIAHNGCLRWQVKTKGKSCHSSYPHKGKNAIYKMAKIISLIENVCQVECERLHHPLTGKAAISVGTIQGGVQVNIVPDSCTIEIDRRTLPHERPEKIIEQFKSRLSKLRREDPEFKVELSEIRENLPLETNKEEKIVQVMEAACRSLLKRCNLRGASWFSNAGEFSRAGISSIVFGPGSVDQAHSANEYVEINQVVKAAEILTEAIKNFNVEK